MNHVKSELEGTSYAGCGYVAGGWCKDATAVFSQTHNLAVAGFRKRGRKMEMKSEFVVLRNVEKGGFVRSFESKKNNLAFNAQLSDEIEDALTLPEKYYLKDKEAYDGMAQMLGAEVVKVKASYELTYLDGSEVQEIEAKEEKSFAEKFFDFLAEQAKDND